jgi:pectin methylesterase-like acyl-CoA thioesterase
MYCRLGAICSLIHPSECTHIAVGGDGAGFRSIQDAFNAAEEGDTIEVQSGIYRENVEKWS